MMVIIRVRLHAGEVMAIGPAGQARRNAMAIKAPLR
jgi:hypothetical protein